MEVQKSAEARVFELLLKSGYKPQDIARQVRTASGGRIDFVLSRSDGTVALVEVKSSGKIPATVDPTETRFDPVARTAQHLAREIDAHFYAISDGQQFLWLETDSEGRPRPAPEPIDLEPTREASSSLQPVTRDEAMAVLLELTDLARRRTSDPELYSLLATYGYLVVERRFVKATWPMEPADLATVWAELGAETLQEKAVHQSGLLWEAIQLLHHSGISQLPAREFLFTIDVAFRSITRSRSFRLPRVLADFLVEIAKVNKTDNVLDIYSNGGDTAAALLLANISVKSVLSLAHDEHSYLWASIQQLVLAADERYTLNLTAPSLVRDEPIEDVRAYDRVIVCPPFGQKVMLNGPKPSEQAYLELALERVRPGGRIVAILPDSILTSERYLDLRNRLLTDYTLSAMFSLDAQPFDMRARTNILIIDNASPFPSSHTAIAEVKPSDLPNNREPVSSLTVPAFREIIEQAATPATWARAATNIYMVPTLDLDKTNLSYAKYGRPSQLRSVYRMVRLSEISRIRKGSNLTLDPLGDLVVIGPAAVRKLSIRAVKLQRTSTSKLPVSPVVAGANDIVINAVGEYRGHSALIGSDFAGYYVSRNLIVLTPTTPEILPAYLAIAMNSEFVQSQLRAATRGNPLPQLTKGGSKEIDLPLPSVEIQQVIISAVKRFLEQAAEAQRLIDENTASLRKAQRALGEVLDSLHIGGGAE